MGYDILIITPSNSFYKVNLFNEMAKERSMLVVFTGSTGGERSADFYKSEMSFDNFFLVENVFRSTVQLMSIVRKYKCKKIIVSGWDYPGTFLLLNLLRFDKVGCIVESSIYESCTHGFRAFWKKLLLNKVDIVLASGVLQKQLVRALGFRNKVVEFGGCGILNYQTQPKFEYRNDVRNFLFVGRLADAKNIDLLVSVFNKLSQFELTIIGTGPEEQKYKSQSNSNIHYLGAIDNRKLPHYYKNADVFVLPSKYEPWGLVVEEALNNGCPVIVSSMVGCSKDLVADVNTGIIFESENEMSLRNAILKMAEPLNYNQFRENVSMMDFQQRAQRQLKAFLEF